MKWIIAHPYWSTFIAIAFITGAIFLIKFLTKDKAPETPAEPENPEPPMQRVKEGYIDPKRGMSGISGIPINVSGVGMSGARVQGSGNIR